MKPSEKSKNTNELMQILSSAKTPEELQAYTETLKHQLLFCRFYLRKAPGTRAVCRRPDPQLYDPAKLRLSASQRNQNTFQR